jgi:prephenate dehydrogenase
MERKKIAIIGVGLIGGSLALQLNEKGLASKLIGVDSNRDHQKKALELNLVDEIMIWMKQLIILTLLSLQYRLMQW